MAKFHGKIGFLITDNSEHTVIHKEKLTEKYYYGDILTNNRKWSAGEGLNDDINISNDISIVADQFAYSNIGAMRYVELYGAKWKVNSASIEFPRIKLSLGGIYND